jgi:hypothetical protein
MEQGWFSCVKCGEVVHGGEGELYCPDCFEPIYEEFDAAAPLPANRLAGKNGSIYIQGPAGEQIPVATKVEWTLKLDDKTTADRDEWFKEFDKKLAKIFEPDPIQERYAKAERDRAERQAQAAKDRRRLQRQGSKAPRPGRR